MARRQDQQRARRRVGLARAVERAEHRRLLALHRAAGDEHRPVRRHAEEAQHALARPRPCDDGVGSSSESNFRLPVTVMRAGSAPRSIRRRADLLALHAEAIDVGEHAAEERPDQPVARDTTAYEMRPLTITVLTPRRAAVAQQVRPDLGLHHHEQARLDDRQRAADDERPVEREVEHRVDVRARCAAPPAARPSSSSTGTGAGAGSAARSSAISGRAVSTSPTDTA